MADVILGQIHPASLRPDAKGVNRETRQALAVARLVRGITATEARGTEIDSMPVNASNKTRAGTAKNAEKEKETELKDDVFLVSEAAHNDAAPTPDVVLPTGAPPLSGATPAVLAPAVRPRRVFALPAVDQTTEAFNVSTAPRRDSAPVELRMPVQGRLSSRFGARHDPIHGHQRFHRGMDIAAPRGTPIRAAGEGTVVFAGRRKGYGNTIVIEHPDGRRTRYAHAERLYAQKGDQVNAGEVIAAVGSTGRSTGPHLHFEVIENGRRVNPLSILTNEFALARR
jgi:murein DD-endopeptidase MepM/ murein hydrolase activator NlpD